MTPQVAPGEWDCQLGARAALGRSQPSLGSDSEANVVEVAATVGATGLYNFIDSLTAIFNVISSPKGFSLVQRAGVASLGFPFPLSLFLYVAFPQF